MAVDVLESAVTENDEIVLTDMSLEDVFFRYRESHDKKYFEELRRRTHPVLLRAVEHIVECPERAQDVVQAVWIAIWDKLDSYEWKSEREFFNWMYTAACNKAKDDKRSLYVRRTTLSSDAVLHTATSRFDTPIESILRAEQRCVIDDALCSLADDTQAVARLRFFEGCFVPDIALRLDLSEAVVKSHIRRSRVILAQKLKLYFACMN